MIESLTSTSVERTVEVILSVLLFMDALDIRDAPRRSRTPVLRVLFLALPLSLIAVFFAAMYLLPDVRLSLCLVLACVLVPSDLARTRHDRVAGSARDRYADRDHPGECGHGRVLLRDAAWSHRAADRAGRRPARARGCQGRASGGHPDGARGMNRRGSAC
ncbi:hypothetical protein [Kocuria sp. UBA1838]|uniref:hypothetical protein n=1 Tax=Kocuria sp. UBA1838 TaxID=1946673 RepID=UPI00257E27DB|nr:hypothetical protein [Kocuria sp. UBA1838]